MRALFIGAHPDDVEIGCGGTLSKLTAAGHDVAVVIMTGESDLELRAVREEESQRALGLVGLSRDEIHFCNLPDGHLRSDADTVQFFRSFLADRKLQPDVVFCHASSDSHGDHRAVHSLCKSTFRRLTFLFYSVVNSSSTTEFQPNLSVDISSYRQTKGRMLEEHKTQIARGRILWKELDRQHRRSAQQVSGEYAEAFETMVQEGDLDGELFLSYLNDNIFMRIWGGLVHRPHEGASGSLTIIYGRSPGGVISRSDGDTFNLDIAALCHLQNLLVTQFPRSGHLNGLSIQSVEASAYGDERYFQAGDVLLLGGPGANNATLRIFNQLSSIRYRIEYSVPHYGDVWVQDLLTGKRYRASYLGQSDGTRVVQRDLAILTVVRNPYRSRGYAVGAMGIHGYGTLAAARLLSGEGDARILLGYLDDVRLSSASGFQVLIETSDGGNTPRIRLNSLHVISMASSPAPAMVGALELPIH